MHIGLYWNQWRDPLYESDRNQAASRIGSYGLADVGMDWDRQRDQIVFDQKVICGIWHGLACAGRLGLELGPRQTAMGLYL